MGRPRTYGARKTHPSVAASALFSSISRNSQHTRFPASPERSALADITSAVTNLNLDADTENGENRVGHNHDDDDDDDGDETTEGPILQVDENDDLEIEDETSILDGKHAHLLPLVTAYGIDTGRKMTTHSWADLLPSDCTVIKISEASYAEVYRITIPSGETSIIKVMRIQSPLDPDSSASDTAIRVENIVSEVRIMNTLTELPGFVRFKDAHIILGRSVQAFIDAYEQREEACKEGRESQFPHPKLYTDASEFLAIELGDAGCVLEDFAVTNIEQVWDILLGTILALAKGEMANEFEHRDLHENNICVSVSPNSSDHTEVSANPDLKLGRAGVKTTLIDYGLSRAKLQDGTIVYLDLEEDPMVFQGSEGHPQFNAYRRMRTTLLTSQRTAKTKSWHASHTLPAHTSWAQYTPYSNVIWIGYMVGYLKKALKKTSSSSNHHSSSTHHSSRSGKASSSGKTSKVGSEKQSGSGRTSKDVLAAFNEETKTLTGRLDPRTKISNGAFGTATEVLFYCVERGWVSEVQAEEYGADVSGVFEC
ncbi:putative serine/threonine-protein kinase haspin-like protein [Lachnellula occidentalis]|uniref:non-specific serine/threonine protein kinase n=1 Tax=Lachnellula occidentalis TaxID=215460 RepID=A0A8H8RLX1_9HELO|nr:putative serine/threonine-protein kinase haspin-like protein [Lachnellula occidentalis]